MPEFEYVMICPNFHVTTTNCLSPTVHDDGSITGYAGSAMDFCDYCEATPTVLELRVKA